MANWRDFKRRVTSVTNTKKITSAMKLVSASKLRRAQESVQKSREYTSALSSLLGELAREQTDAEFTHPLMEVRPVIKNTRFLIIGGNRGLCGSYNTNINKKIESSIRERVAAQPNFSYDSVIIGRKPAEYYRRVKRNYLSSYEALSDDPNSWPIDDICTQLEVDFVNGAFDELYLIYTKFKSALSMTVMCEKILPLSTDLGAQAAATTKVGGSGNTLFEPSPQEVFSALVPRVLRSIVRQGALDAKAGEYGSRMTAMDAATKNAGELAKKLTLTMNKLRQSGITGELLDIVGGAEAIN